MKYNIGLILICFSLLSGLETKAQEQTYEPKLSFGVDVGIPTLGRNKAFKQVMEGLFNGGLTLQYNVFKGATIGIGAKYSYFNLNTYLFNNANWKGGIHMPAPYVRLSYEKFTTERISLSAGVKIGYAAMISANDSCKVKMGKPYTVGALFFEPQVEVLMLTGKNSSDGFSFVMGYNFYLRDFTTDFLCIDNIPNLKSDSYQGITRFLSIGFAYRYYFGRR